MLKVMSFARILARRVFGGMLFPQLKALPLHNGSSLNAVVYCEEDGLCRIDLLMVAYSWGGTEESGYIALDLYEKHSAVSLRHCVVKLEDVEDNKYCTFIFDPLSGYKNRELIVGISANYENPDSSVGIYNAKDVDNVGQEVIYDGTKIKSKPVCLLFYQDSVTEKQTTSSVSTIIVNYNALSYIKDCLESITRQTYPKHEIIVVDNGSSDGSREFIQDNYPGVKLLALPRNVDFAAANNAGLVHATGDYILVLNPDTSVPPDFVVRMVETIEWHPRVGAVGCNVDTRGSYIRYATVFLASNRLVEGNRTAIRNHVFCLAPCGAAAMYRRSVLDELQEFFDEEFVTNWEDHELGFRMNLYGYFCLHNPDIVIKHIGGSAYGLSIKRLIKMYRNMLLTYFKNMEWHDFVTAFCRILWGLEYVTSLVGIYLFFQEIIFNPGIWKKRKRVQRERRRSDAYVQMIAGGKCHWREDTTGKMHGIPKVIPPAK